MTPEEMAAFVDGAVTALDDASHHIKKLSALVEHLRSERDQLRRALYETSYCLTSLDITPSALTKSTADTLVQMNLGGFCD
jgi:hypothetical protein